MTVTPSHSRLIIDHLTISRGGIVLIDGLNLHLDAGQLIFLRGANGTGKTTLLRGLAGLIPLDHGNFSINGVSNNDDHTALMRQLILVGHRNASLENLTVAASLRLMANLMDMYPDHPQILAALDSMDIKPLALRQISHLSSGQQRRLALSRLALASTMCHRLWLIDEPFNALDSNATDHLCDLITTYCKNGGSAIISGHGEMPLKPDLTLTLGKTKWGDVS